MLQPIEMRIIYDYKLWIDNLTHEIGDLNERLEKSIRDNLDSSMKSNVHASMTNYSFRTDEMKELHEHLEMRMNEVVKQKIFKPSDYKINFIENWGAIYRKNDKSNPHHHAPFDWSWIYYVKAEYGDAPLVFHNLAPNSAFNHIEPKTSDLVIFPSQVMHSVPKHENDNERIVAVGNIRLDLVSNMNYPISHMIRK